jgi:hypothetical protein
MERRVFNHIREGMVAYDDYFECKEDALGKVGFSSYRNALRLFGCLHTEFPVILWMSMYA